MTASQIGSGDILFHVIEALGVVHDVAKDVYEDLVSLVSAWKILVGEIVDKLDELTDLKIMRWISSSWF